MDKLKQALARASHLPKALRLIWAAAPGWTRMWAVLLFVQGLTPAALVYLTKGLVDSVVGAMNSGGSRAEVRLAIVYSLAVAAIMVLSASLDSLIDWVRTAQAELIQDHIRNLIHKQSTVVDFAFYETPEFYDQLDQARGEASTRPLAILESFGNLVQSSITLLAMTAILIPYGLLLPIALFLSTLPAFYVVLRFDQKYHQWWQTSTTNRRRAQYYDVILTGSHSAAEVRLFGLGERLRESYQKLRQQLRSQRIKHLQKQSSARLLASIAGLLVACASMVWMGWRAISGKATLGDLALFYQTFSRGQALVQGLLSNLGRILTNSLFLGNLFKFLELKPKVTSPPHPKAMPANLQQGIEFRNVTFRYPGSNRPALRDFNLSIPAGKIVAIVGSNGAGKTTLLKLLCRFYDPEQGGVKLDGVDLREFSVDDVWRQLTVLFQHPVNHHATAWDSIAMSNFGETPSAAEIERAARDAGAHDFIARLPQGYDTILGKWFGAGAELSGGEWQRVATARAYLRRSPIILLDEPTSFMDSWSEVDWFSRFRTLASGRTGLMITHRFTIAMRADIIHVMDKGEIVESGTHHELLALDGLYSQSWVAQMQASAVSNNEEVAPFVPSHSANMPDLELL